LLFVQTKHIIVSWLFVILYRHIFARFSSMICKGVVLKNPGGIRLISDKKFFHEWIWYLSFVISNWWKSKDAYSFRSNTFVGSLFFSVLSVQKYHMIRLLVVLFFFQIIDLYNFQLKSLGIFQFSSSWHQLWRKNVPHIRLFLALWARLPP
jgi:hypothetical protein